VCSDPYQILFESQNAESIGGQIRECTDIGIIQDHYNAMGQENIVEQALKEPKQMKLNVQIKQFSKDE